MDFLFRRLPAKTFWLLSLVFAMSGAAAAAAVPDNIHDWEALWTSVLSKNVSETGSVDFAALARDHTELDRVVTFINVNDPISRPAMFPTKSARLAYYINAYNALAMHGVVEAGIPDNLGGLRKFTFFYFRSFTIGGKDISLYKFESDVIRPIGEPRIHFALNCMVVSCPRLPRTAFTADKLERQLDAAARGFVGERRNVNVDVLKKVLWLSEIFKFYTVDFTAVAPSLIDYVNRYRAEKIPENFSVQYLDYNWTVNNAGNGPE